MSSQKVKQLQICQDMIVCSLVRWKQPVVQQIWSSFSLCHLVWSKKFPADNGKLTLIFFHLHH